MNTRLPASWVRNWISAFVDPRRALGILNLPRYFSDWSKYGRLGYRKLSWRESYPCLSDWVKHSPFDPHYFYQSYWAASKIAQRMPRYHVDIGSLVLFVGVTSAFVPTLFVDYRPVQAFTDGLVPLAGDLMALPLADSSILSLSCMHVIEHIGLGRYGDHLDPDGSIKAAKELVRVLAKGGRLLLSTLVGRERIQFNAHRIFSPEKVREIFNPLTMVDFAYVDDAGNFHPHASPYLASKCSYACGMFEFERSIA
jgi:SAM-dependent methyltransferase